MMRGVIRKWGACHPIHVGMLRTMRIMQRDTKPGSRRCLCALQLAYNTAAHLVRASSVVEPAFDK